MTDQERASLKEREAKLSKKIREHFVRRNDIFAALDTEKDMPRREILYGESEKNRRTISDLDGEARQIRLRLARDKYGV